MALSLLAHSSMLGQIKLPLLFSGLGLAVQCAYYHKVQEPRKGFSKSTWTFGWSVLRSGDIPIFSNMGKRCV